jgi:hypothetical protein
MGNIERFEEATDEFLVSAQKLREAMHALTVEEVREEICNGLVGLDELLGSLLMLEDELGDGHAPVEQPSRTPLTIGDELHADAALAAEAEAAAEGDL